MTQAELEQVAREIRARGLHSSWDNLVEYSRDLVGNLAEAYRLLLENSLLSQRISSTNPDSLQAIAKDKLAKALTLLTSKAQVARLESEMRAGNSMSTLQKGENPRVGGQGA